MSSFALSRKTLLSAVLALVGFLIVFGIMGQAGLGDISLLLSRINFDWFLYAMLASVIWTLFKNLRWYNILRASRARVPFGKLYLVTLSGTMIDYITPIYRLGSEAARSYMLLKFAKIKPGRSMATIIADRFFDIVLYLGIAAFAMVLLSLRPIPLEVKLLMFLSVLGLGALALYVVYISLRPAAAHRFLRRIFRILKIVPSMRPKIKSLEASARRQINIYSKTLSTSFWTNAMLNLLITIVMIALEIIRVQLILISLGLHVDLIWIFGMMGAIILAGVLPSPPGGVGLVEPVGIGAFLYAGLTLSQATSVILLDRIIAFGFVAFLGFAATLRLGLHGFRRGGVFMLKPMKKEEAAKEEGHTI